MKEKNQAICVNQHDKNVTRYVLIVLVEDELNTVVQLCLTRLQTRKILKYSYQSVSEKSKITSTEHFH